MDLTLLPPPATSRARFTIRSASSPSYCLGCRSGVGTLTAPPTQDDRKGRDTARKTDTHVNRVDASHTVGSIASRSETRAGGVATRREDGGTSNGEMATRSSQSDTGDGENSDWAERRRLYQHNNSKSNGLDRREGPSGPQHRSSIGTLSFSGSQGERGTTGRDRDGAEVTSPAGKASGCAGTGCASGDGRRPSDSSPGPGHAAQAPDRVAGARTLPSRLKSRSMFGSTSGPRETSVSLGAKGGQSIWERIEKLYGSADDPARAKRFSAPLEDWRLPSHEDAAAVVETAAGRRRSTTDSPLSPPISQWRDVCVSGGLRRQSREARGKSDVATWNGGTMSLDRSRSRQSVAAQIRRARAAETAVPSPTSTPGEEDTKACLPDPSGLGEGGASGTKDRDGSKPERGREADVSGGEKGTTGRSASNDAERAGEPEKDRRADARAKTAENVKEAESVGKGSGGSLCEDTFKFGASLCEDTFKFAAQQKIHVKITEVKKLVVPSVASVRNKISQYEALTQRANGGSAGAGQHQKPRRAFSVPDGELGGGGGSHDDGPKKSESDRAVGRLRGRGAGGRGGSARERDATAETTGGVRKSRSDRAIDELSAGGKTRFGTGQNEGGSDRTLAGIWGETQGEGRRQTRLNAASASTGSVDPNTQSRERRGGDRAKEEGSGGRSLPVVESDSKPTARVLSLPLSNSNNNNSSLPDQTTYDPADNGDDLTPTNPDSPCPSSAVTVHGDEDGTVVSSSQGQKLSSGPSQHLPSLLSATSTKSAPGKLPDVVPSSPLQVLSLSSVKSEGRDDTLETWVKTQGAADDTLEAWVTTWNHRIQGWNDEDDDEGTEKDHDSNYDSDESSATITSSQSDRRSFCVSLADLCNLGGVDYESESDSSEDWSNSLRSDMSALSCVSVLPTEELERLLQDVRGLGDSTLQSYEDVQVVVLHKEVGGGLGFSIAGGLDQNKPVTVHKVFPSGVAAQEGSIREGDHVLSINGTALCSSAHFEALRTLRRAKERGMGVVVLRRGRATAPCKAGGGVQGSAQTPPTGQRVCVRLEKRSRDLGFSLEGGAGSSLGDKPLSIQKIFQGGPVEQVCPGDQLLQIQDVSVVGMRRLEVWTLIKTLPPGPVDVVLHRPHKTPQT